jgi:glycosyltransferase involved in cell wall biosynthesis
MDKQVPAYQVLKADARRHDACVVIPVLNEGARIQRLLQRMRALKIEEAADVIIVDGGSTDGSLSDEHLGGVRAVIRKTGPGKLSAQLLCAYDFALSEGYQGIVTIDGNDKDDPDAIPAFLKALLEGYDFVQASRFIPGSVEENTPAKRRLAIRLIHAPALSLASGFHWTDTTQGFRAYSRRLLEDPRVAIFRDVFSTYELLAYLNYRAPRLGYRCIELPTARRYPHGEKPPTKIAPFSGEIELLGTLLKVCLGGFNPGPTA